MIIIPDIHGRDFWKEVTAIEDEEFVFLGDYVDPYPLRVYLIRLQVNQLVSDSPEELHTARTLNISVFCVYISSH